MGTGAGPVRRRVGAGSRLRLSRIAPALLVLGWLGCAPVDDRSPLRLATTTSVDDSGLLEALVPGFEAAHPEYRLQWIAVGTGEALEIGRRGDADVVLVHAPAAESAFVAQGHGLERREVMRNDFLIVGPPGDPAGIRGLRDASTALARIAEAGAPFVSRGDDSGTHRKELELWAAAGIRQPAAAWRAAAGGARGGYLEAGQGMGAVLMMAAQRDAYTLTDRGTYLVMADRLRLEPLMEGDARLTNPYAVIQVRTAANPTGARVFVDWITGAEGQRIIEGFGAGRYARPLFEPSAPAATR